MRFRVKGTLTFNDITRPSYPLGQVMFEAADQDEANDLVFDLFWWRVPQEYKHVLIFGGVGFEWLDHWGGGIKYVVPETILKKIRGKLE